MDRPNRFISMSETLDRVGFSKTHIYRLINKGEFPKPVPLGRFKVAFLETEVDQWMESRLAAREEGEGTEERRARAIKSVTGSAAK